MASSRALSDEQIQTYHRDGYVVAKGMLDEDESGLLLQTVKRDTRVADHAMGWPDGEGGLSKITL